MLCERRLHETPILHNGRAVIAPPGSIHVETAAGGYTYHMPAIPAAPGPDELELLRRQMTPVGAIVLTADACPSEFFADVTAEYDGRFLMAGDAAAGQPILVDGDGSHAHEAHGHGIDVETSNAANSANERRGYENHGASHVEHSHRVQGATAQAVIAGGIHTHRSMGPRLCRKIAAATVASR